MGVGFHVLRVTEHRKELAPRRTVTVGKSLERGLLTFGEVFACRLDVFVDSGVSINFGGLPAIAHPLVARFGKCRERVAVGCPVVAAQLPVFELGSVLVEVVADDFQCVGETRKEDARGEKPCGFHDLDESVEARGAACGAVQFLR